MASSDPNDHINGDFPSLPSRPSMPMGPLRRPGATSMNAVDEITTRTSVLSVNNTPSSNGPSTSKLSIEIAKSIYSGNHYSRFKPVGQ